jgi:hypothetical protein
LSNEFAIKRSFTNNRNMKIQTESVIEVQDWDALVSETYGRPYNLQQQDGCQSRGIRRLTVPDEADDFEATTVPEIVNHDDMGVSFETWKARDPKQILSEGEECRAEPWAIDLWWSRNFYPDLQMVANDLHAKGLLPAGQYIINIDW